MNWLVVVLFAFCWFFIGYKWGKDYNYSLAKIDFKRLDKGGVYWFFHKGRKYVVFNRKILSTMLDYFNVNLTIIEGEFKKHEIHK